MEPGETKNREGRMFPLMETLCATLERQLAKTEATEKGTGQIIPWLFHRNGKPIKSYRRAWLTARTRAGLPGKIPHDFHEQRSETSNALAWLARQR
jgi:integrase